MTNVRDIETDTLIIGAGPAGLAAALELSKRGKQFVVLEKEASVGGLSRTYTFRERDLEFHTDNGPHRFFSKNPYLYEVIGALLKDDWIQVRRQTRQYIDGKFYDYPINFKQAFRNIGALRAAGMLLGYLAARVRYTLFRKPIRSFEDYVIAHFGRPLGEFNMINYTEKIWGIPAKDIHPDWASQRIKGLSVRSLAASAMRSFTVGSSETPKTLIDAFYYPRKGTGLIYETIAKRLRAQGYQIVCGVEVLEVQHAEGRMVSVLARDIEGQLRIRFNHLVESVPLPAFIRLLSPRAPEELVDLLPKLRYRSQAYLFLTLDKKSITGDQWIYFPSKEIPFARISEMKNFSPYMAPPGKTSLFVEFFCFKCDPIWNMTDKQLLRHAMPHFMKMGFFSSKDVRSYYVLRKEDVYPIYDIDYETSLRDLKTFPDGFANLYYIGRPGRFRYNNQDHSLEMGIAAAESIITGERQDIDAIGAEKEYYEAGQLTTGEKKLSE